MWQFPPNHIPRIRAVFPRTYVSVHYCVAIRLAFACLLGAIYDTIIGCYRIPVGTTW